jgi:hypothetical protein
MHTLTEYPDLTTGYRQDIAQDRQVDTLEAGPSLFDAVTWVEDLPTWGHGYPTH